MTFCTMTNSKAARFVYVPLQINPDNMMLWYSGSSNVVEAKSLDGRVVHFPANILRPFVTRYGVKGLFKISYTLEGKYLSIERCDTEGS